jgi:hypothetical protein
MEGAARRAHRTALHACAAVLPPLCTSQRYKPLLYQRVGALQSPQPCSETARGEAVTRDPRRSMGHTPPALLGDLGAETGGGPASRE